MLLLYKLLYLTFFHYSLYLPMMRRERNLSVTKLACIFYCFYFASQVKRAIMPNVMMTMDREKGLRTRLVILDYRE